MFFLTAGFVKLSVAPLLRERMASERDPPFQLPSLDVHVNNHQHSAGDGLLPALGMGRSETRERMT